jgi:antirestriction protein ArdC
MTIYETITQRICDRLRQGTVPWHRPWSGGALPRNLFSQQLYHGVNVWLLAAQPYASPYWLTFHQLSEIGGHIRPGEHGTPVGFWKRRDIPPDPDTTNADTRPSPRPLLRYYLVWNTEQCELPASLTAKLDLPHLRPFDPIQQCEEIVRHMPQRPAIVHEGHRACYLPTVDSVYMPAPGRFEGAEAYYATLFHELCHASGHATRLGRPSLQGPCPFGSARYSEEELTAELGAAFLCGITGIDPMTVDSSAAYLEFWLRRVQHEPRVFFGAATQGQKAADYILGKTPGNKPFAADDAAGTAVDGQA